MAGLLEAVDSFYPIIIIFLRFPFSFSLSLPFSLFLFLSLFIIHPTFSLSLSLFHSISSSLSFTSSFDLSLSPTYFFFYFSILVPSFVEPSVTTTAIQWRYYLCGAAEKYQFSCLSVTPGPESNNAGRRPIQCRFADELHPAEAARSKGLLDNFHPRGTEGYFLRQLYWRPNSFHGNADLLRQRVAGYFQESVFFFFSPLFSFFFLFSPFERKNRSNESCLPLNYHLGVRRIVRLDSFESK